MIKKYEFGHSAASLLETYMICLLYQLTPSKYLHLEHLVTLKSSSML
jgi:hypothetical protein